MLLVPLCMSLCLCWPCCKLCVDGSSEPVISSLTVLPFWHGVVVILMLPTGMLLPITLFPSCEASACTPSSVVGLAYLFCFCFLLPTHTMPPLHNPCWHGLGRSTTSILGSFAWTPPIGAYASSLGFIACLALSPSWRSIPRT